MISKKCILSSVLLLLTVTLSAEIRLPAIISDNMVLQREAEVLLWGYAPGHDQVIVIPSWSDKKYLAKTGSDGHFELRIGTTTAGGPYEITFKAGNEKKVLNNVMLGEVWLCGGQSNMDISFRGLQNQPVSDAADEIIDSAYPDLRLFRVNRDYNPEPQSDCTGSWKESDTRSAETFSAIGFIFGKMLHCRENVPVGMITCSWGGSRVEAWMSRECLMQFAGVKIPENIDPKRANVTPSALYNGMLYPIGGYTVKGCLFYQGEANVTDPDGYREKFPAMVKDWRRLWKHDFPFFYVQLAPFSYANMGWGSEQTQVARFREVQYQCLEDIPDSGIIPTVDIGAEYTIHPSDKRTVAKRFLYQAYSKVYGYKGFEPDAPAYSRMEISGGRIRIHFDHAPYGLSASGQEIKGFEIAGKDRVFYPAKAVLGGRSIVEVSSDRVTEPIAVRYCYKNYSEGNLYNNYGMPVLPFRTDDWDFCSYEKDTVAVIFETDMGNDVDDALALDMLYKYQEKGMADLLMVSVNKRHRTSAPFVCLMNSFYGHDDVPVAFPDESVLPEQNLKEPPYTAKVLDSGLFRDYMECHSEPVKKYREILASHPDHSVVIISTGFLSNLKMLLESGPDEYSSLDGKELVARKVKFMSMMGGCFTDRNRREFNIRIDIPAAKYVFENWPGDIYVCPWELGGKVFYRSEALENLDYMDPHPLKEAYINFLPMPYDRECWDQAAVIAGVEGCHGQFKVSRRGRVNVDDAGHTEFVPDNDGNVMVLSIPDGKEEELASYIENMVNEVPAKYVK